MPMTQTPMRREPSALSVGPEVEGTAMGRDPWVRSGPVNLVNAHDHAIGSVPQ